MNETFISLIEFQPSFLVRLTEAIREVYIYVVGGSGRQVIYERDQHGHLLSVTFL